MLPDQQVYHHHNKTSRPHRGLLHDIGYSLMLPQEQNGRLLGTLGTSIHQPIHLMTHVLHGVTGAVPALQISGYGMPTTTDGLLHQEVLLI